MANENLQKMNTEPTDVLEKASTPGRLLSDRDGDQQATARPARPETEPLLQWRVYKYELLEKMPLIRIAGGSGILGLIAVILLLQRNYFGATTFLAAGVVVALLLTRKPPIASCAILPSAIVFQSKRYAFADLEGFAVTLDRLIIFPKNKGTAIHIPIDPQDGDEIHNVLAAHLEARAYDPTLLDVLEQFLRI